MHNDFCRGVTNYYQTGQGAEVEEKIHIIVEEIEENKKQYKHKLNKDEYNEDPIIPMVKLFPNRVTARTSVLISKKRFGRETKFDRFVFLYSPA